MARMNCQHLWCWIGIALVLMSTSFDDSYGRIIASATELEGFGDDLEGTLEDEEFIHPEVEVSVPIKIPTKSLQNDGKTENTLEEAPADARNSESIWSDDEFEGATNENSGLSQNLQQLTSKSKEKARIGKPKRPKRPLGPLDFVVEALGLMFIAIYGFNYWTGKKENEKIALAWAEQFAVEDCIFHKNFSLLGTGDGEDDPLMFKEGQNVFKLYASGRRFCEGMLATIELANRHDLISVLWGYVIPKKDTVHVEVLMNDDSMEPFVLAVTRRKLVKSFQKKHKDLKEFGILIDFSTRRKWPVEELAVISDSREAAFDLLSDAIVESIFAEKVFEKVADLFVSLHFSDQYPLGAHKKVLAFNFNLPSRNKMADLTRLIASIPYFIDAVGRLKLSPALKSKADVVRAKWLEGEGKEEQELRLEAVSKRKEEKKRAEEARRAEIEARLSPADLARRQEKEQRKAMKKAAPKMKLTKAH